MTRIIKARGLVYLVLMPLLKFGSHTHALAYVNDVRLFKFQKGRPDSYNIYPPSACHTCLMALADSQKLAAKLSEERRRYVNR